MIHKSYYAILGVTNTATHEEIIKGYKKMVQMVHPGKGSYYIHKLENKSDSEYLNDLSESFNILTNKTYKKIYDDKGYEEVRKFIESRDYDKMDARNKEAEELVKKN
jgi:DnaJ-class molecular chaperone